MVGVVGVIRRKTLVLFDQMNKGQMVTPELVNDAYGTHARRRTMRSTIRHQPPARDREQRRATLRAKRATMRQTRKAVVFPVSSGNTSGNGNGHNGEASIGVGGATSSVAMSVDSNQSQKPDLLPNLSNGPQRSPKSKNRATVKFA
jgi:hypothetical protein